MTAGTVAAPQAPRAGVLAPPSLRPLRGMAACIAPDDAPDVLRHPDTLGVLRYDGEPGLLRLSAAPACDAWLAGPIVAAGAHDGLRWRHDGRWLWGEVAVPTVPDLAAAVAQAYGLLFETLAATGFRHPLRLWNYLPDIHGDDDNGADVLERYRRFNAARQQAFLDAGWPAFDGAPAACCLGSPAGNPLCLRVLAAREAPRAIENPRQVSAYRYPTEHGPRSPTFSRAVLADAGAGQALLLVSGTASIVGHTSMHPGDLAGQIDETLANLNAVIAEVHRQGSARFDLRTLQLVAYLRDQADADALTRTLAARLGADCPALRSLVMLQAEVCRRELLVEIEAQACAPGGVTA